MDFELPEEMVQFQAKVRAFAEEDVAPVAAALDAEEAFPEEPVRRAAELGFLGLVVPRKYGGEGLGNLAGSLLVEEVSRVCPSTAVTLSVHNSLVCTPVRRHGSETIKKRYLPRLASGELLGAYALSEAGSGSDAAALSCRAEKKGDRWVLNGAKLWISSGTHAGLFVVFARTRDVEEAGKKSRGITAFLVERGTPGLRIGKKEQKLGIRASSTVEILLDGCEIPGDSYLGELDRGFSIALETLDGGRIGIASQSLGIAQGCLDASVAYAKERQQFGEPIANFQAVQWKIAQIATRLDAARLLTRRAAWLRDRGEPCTPQAAMAKLMASQLANFAAEEAVQIHGTAGLKEGALVERLFRDARITEIYEGTTEIQHLVIARHVLS